MVATHDLAILEGIVLDHCRGGCSSTGRLSATQVEGADASPVRAVLIKEDSMTISLSPHNRMVPPAQMRLRLMADLSARRA